MREDGNKRSTMTGAVILDAQITREFSFIQELIWSPPHKNPFPRCSDKIIVSLKRFRDLFKNSSLHNVQVIIDNFGSILDADTRALIDLRHSYCKILASIQHLPFLRDAIVNLEMMVDDTIVRHIEMAWGKVGNDPLDFKAEMTTHIDIEALDANVKKYFQLYDPQAGANHVKKENIPQPEVIPNEEQGATLGCVTLTRNFDQDQSDGPQSDSSPVDNDGAVFDGTEEKLQNRFGILEVSENFGQMEQQIGLQPECVPVDNENARVTDGLWKSAPGEEQHAHFDVLKECCIKQASAVGLESDSGIEECIFQAPDPELGSLHADNEGDGEQVGSKGQEEFVQQLEYEDQKFLAFCNTEASNEVNNSRILNSLDSSPQKQDLVRDKTLFEPKDEQSAIAEEDNQEEKGTQHGESINQPHHVESLGYEDQNSLSNGNTEVHKDNIMSNNANAFSSAGCHSCKQELFTQAYIDQSAGAMQVDREADSTEQGGNLDGHDQLQSLVYEDNRLNGCTTEFQYEHKNNTAGTCDPVGPQQVPFMQAEEGQSTKMKNRQVSNTAANRKLPVKPVLIGKASELQLPFVADEVSQGSDALLLQQRSSIVNRLLEVEMTTRAKLCAKGIMEPYWNVIFGLINHSCHRIGVTGLSFWSLNSVKDITTVKWSQGEVILKEHPSFLCYSIKVPCQDSFDSPQMAFSWQYSKFLECSPNAREVANNKAEGRRLKKRLGSALSWATANKKGKAHSGEHLTS